MNAANSCSHGIKNGVLSASEFAYAEVSRTFVKPKKNVNASHAASKEERVEIWQQDSTVVRSVKGEVITNESKGLSCPDSHVSDSRDLVAGDRLAKASLSIFGYAGSGE